MFTDCTEKIRWKWINCFLQIFRRAMPRVTSHSDLRKLLDQGINALIEEYSFLVHSKVKLPETHKCIQSNRTSSCSWRQPSSTSRMCTADNLQCRLSQIRQGLRYAKSQSQPRDALAILYMVLQNGRSAQETNHGADTIRRVDAFVEDRFMDVYLDHLRQCGGSRRQEQSLILPMFVAQLVWYGSDTHVVRELGYGSSTKPKAVYLILNTTDPHAMERDGGRGTHWITVVLLRDKGILVWDSMQPSAGKHYHLPRNKKTSNNLHELFGIPKQALKEAETRATERQRENDCALFALQNLEVLYRLCHWDPKTIDVRPYYKPKLNRRAALADFIAINFDGTDGCLGCREERESHECWMLSQK